MPKFKKNLQDGKRFIRTWTRFEKKPLCMSVSCPSKFTSKTCLMNYRDLLAANRRTSRCPHPTNVLNAWPSVHTITKLAFCTRESNVMKDRSGVHRNSKRHGNPIQNPTAILCKCVYVYSLFSLRKMAKGWLGAWGLL